MVAQYCECTEKKSLIKWLISPPTPLPIQSHCSYLTNPGFISKNLLCVFCPVILQTPQTKGALNHNGNRLFPLSTTIHIWYLTVLSVDFLLPPKHIQVSKQNYVLIMGSQYKPSCIVAYRLLFM